MLLGANPLISVTPGLMIWTLIAFAITFQWPGGVSESGPSAQNSAWVGVGSDP